MSFKTTQITGAVASGAGTTKKPHQEASDFSRAALRTNKTKFFKKKKKKRILPCGSRKLVRFGGGAGEDRKIPSGKDS